jgi:peptidoglycan/LPS O-acetylase OafA/YrhL
MNNKSATFYPQLDSLRAIAVLLVIISHWFSPHHLLNRYTPNGILGVTLFFVLSGFLITGILLRSKMQIEQGYPAYREFKIFYIRRALRIFPVYYLLLLILVLFNIANITKSFWWHFFYVSNFYFWHRGSFEGWLSPLWSLSVEEQFYIFWPAIIFFINRRWLPLAFLIGIIVAVLFRYAITVSTNDLGRLLMPGSLDSFCLGGLIAYGKEFKTKGYLLFKKYNNWSIVFAFICLVAVNVFLKQNKNMLLFITLYFLIISAVFAVLIDWVADGVKIPIVSSILNNRVLRYLGKISYGIYLIHNFIPYLYGVKLPVMLEPFSLYIAQLLRLLIVVGLASASWYLFEKPILQLKKRFEYDRASMLPAVS